MTKWRDDAEAVRSARFPLILPIFALLIYGVPTALVIELAIVCNDPLDMPFWVLVTWGGLVTILSLLLMHWTIEARRYLWSKYGKEDIPNPVQANQYR
jgi:uncharacterized protein (DUF983 family)